MPILLIVLGVLLLVAGFKHTAKAVLTQLEVDLQGFASLGVVIIVVGFAGLNKTIRPISNIFLILVFVVFFLRRGNMIVSGITDAVKAAPASDTSPVSQAPTDTGAPSSGTDLGSIVGNVTNAIAGAATSSPSSSPAPAAGSNQTIYT